MWPGENYSGYKNIAQQLKKAINARATIQICTELTWHLEAFPTYLWAPSTQDTLQTSLDYTSWYPNSSTLTLSIQNKLHVFTQSNQTIWDLEILYFFPQNISAACGRLMNSAVITGVERLLPEGFVSGRFCVIAKWGIFPPVPVLNC